MRILPVTIIVHFRVMMSRIDLPPTESFCIFQNPRTVRGYRPLAVKAGRLCDASAAQIYRGLLLKQRSPFHAEEDVEVSPLRCIAVLEVHKCEYIDFFSRRVCGDKIS